MVRALLSISGWFESMSVDIYAIVIVCSDECEQHQREHLCAERQQMRDTPAERLIGAAAAVLNSCCWVLVRGAELGLICEHNCHRDHE